MDKKTLYAVASYGTGNLGDDAIFNGLCNIYRKEWDIVQVYSLRPTYKSAIDVNVLLEKGFPDDAGKLVIGGGGLFFDERVTKDLNRIAGHASEAGIPIELVSVGLETAPQSCYPGMRRIFNRCQKITVRSRQSQQILKRLGHDGSLVPDLSSHIKPDMTGAAAIMPHFQNELPIIGLATAGSRDTEFVASIVSLLTVRLNVLHIPHAKHFDDPNNNEIATGEMIWSAISIYSEGKLGRYKCLPYPESPEILLGVYSFLDIVFGYRYHSFLFAEMMDVLLFGMPHGLKAKSYFTEHLSIPHSNGTEEREEIVAKISSCLRGRVTTYA